MNTLKKEFEISAPKYQNQLFGYENYFKSFVTLFNKGKLPNVILLSGQKGIGKSTFAYHFINYLLSLNETNNYSLDAFRIKPANKSFINICNNTHPNFISLDSESPLKNIKIDNVRNIIKFLNKSTYSTDFKIVLIDNVENLNIYSSNSLLKSLEESGNKTFFFIIHDSSHKISYTIKSRSLDFKIFFNPSQKEKILYKLLLQYEVSLSPDKYNQFLYFSSPGNILKFLMTFRDDLINDPKSCILQLSNKYKKNNDPELLNFISLLIELFYTNLAKKNKNNLNYYFFNKFNLIKQIDDMKKYNLDKKNLFFTLINTLENEK